MIRLAALIADESKWLPVSMILALLACAIFLLRHRDSPLYDRRRISASLNLFFGVTIGTMALGHLLAVTTKFATGTLRGSILFLYVIGTALAVPSWWLAYHSRQLPDSNRNGKRTLALNLWLIVTLLILGIHNLPLAVPGLLNIGYQLHSRRLVGWAILSAAIVINLSLFIGALIFMASGQSFEQFSGIE